MDLQSVCPPWTYDAFARKNTNKILMLEAFKNTPSLIIDCSNAANPHKYYGIIEEETLKQVYIQEVEMLYKYRDIIKQLPNTIKKIKPKIILITNTKYLFNYQNEHENKLIHLYCNKQLKKLSKTINIIKAE